MEHNLQPGSGMSHGNSSVGRIPKALLSQGPLSPEQLADILDEPHTRRAWWLDLHTSADLRTGTTFSDLESAVGKAAHKHGQGIADHPNDCTCSICWANKCGAFTPEAGSNGQPAAAPVFTSSRCLRIDHAHTIDQGCFELRPYEQRRAELRA